MRLRPRSLPDQPAVGAVTTDDLRTRQPRRTGPPEPLETGVRPADRVRPEGKRAPERPYVDRDEPRADRGGDRTDVQPRFMERPAVLRVPSFSLLAPIAGWLVAWGAAASAVSSLREAGVGVGFGFGIADGGVDLDAGFWAGLWTLVIQGGAFLFGGYVAGRMARANALGHAILAWVFALAATAADAIIVTARDSASVLAPLGLPHWAGLDYDNVIVLPLVIFAVGGLIAAIVGGTLAAGANRADERNPLETARTTAGEF